MKLRTLTNVGPAASMRVTRRPYHHTAPHLSPSYRASGTPTSSIGAVTNTGKKRYSKCMNRRAVRIGSHIPSRRNAKMRDKKCGSAGERIVGTRGKGSLSSQGMIFGDFKSAAVGVWDLGER